ncbi:MAG: hypothetical protein HON90_17060 [Halobacteriovoraceae bacterium]|jgi:hypothetical protein|nr:hypothetical protein [Halobacteriovoraceae bacterium]
MDRSELENILSASFGVQRWENQLDSESEYLKKVQEALANRIKYFIRTDVDKLFQILYKVDVSQSDTDKAFDLGDINLVSLKIAENIINRQLRKIDYAREFYKKGEKL